MSSTLSGNSQPSVPQLCSDIDWGLPGKSMALGGMLRPIFQHCGQRQLPNCTPRQVFFWRVSLSSTFLWLPSIILPSYRYKYRFTSIRWATVIELTMPNDREAMDEYVCCLQECKIIKHFGNMVKIIVIYCTALAPQRSSLVRRHVQKFSQQHYL